MISQCLKLGSAALHDPASDQFRHRLLMAGTRNETRRKGMNHLRSVAISVAFALGAQGASATTMRCGDTVIDDEQLVPATAAQVQAACGDPTSKEPGQWVYQQLGQPTMVLQFDSDGNLQSINEQAGSD
jgi:hypothetical protein